MRNVRSARTSGWLLALGLSANGALAQVPPAAPENVVSLTASATTEVAKDQMTVVFSVTREGSDAGAVQSQLKQALDAALAEARKVAKPTQLEVQTGNFSLSPRYTPKGTINGWAGSTELVVEGRDMPGIAQLTGRISTMTIARVSFSLSREAREKVEGEVSGQAIARYRAKAEQIARQFGFTGFALREVQVTSNESMPIGQPMLMRAQAAKIGDESLPVEAGKANVTASVSGSVKLLK